MSRRRRGEAGEGKAGELEGGNEEDAEEERGDGDDDKHSHGTQILNIQ